VSDVEAVEQWVIKDRRPCYWCARPRCDEKHDIDCPGEGGVPESHRASPLAYVLEYSFFYKPGEVEREIRATNYYGVRVRPGKEWG
jgi:hypothetical protein